MEFDIKIHFYSGAPTWFNFFKLGVRHSNNCLLLISIYQDFSAPQKVKDFRWKLKNLDLHQDQLIRWLMELSDQNPEDFEKIKKEINEDIERRKNA
ncbi:hypothetical protein [Acinetobacter baumannii]|uniref:hypothetical protein n=1 Tax=Acinetobacter baumannii TaxID=470 RepID=UPI0034E8801D